MTTLCVIKHQFHDSWDTALAIQSFPAPTTTSRDNESEESNLNSLGEWQEGQGNSGTWRTFPIKQGHWLYQFHGVKV